MAPHEIGFGEASDMLKTTQRMIERVIMRTRIDGALRKQLIDQAARSKQLSDRLATLERKQRHADI